MDGIKKKHKKNEEKFLNSQENSMLRYVKKTKTSHGIEHLNTSVDGGSDENMAENINEQDNENVNVVEDENDGAKQ